MTADRRHARHHHGAEPGHGGIADGVDLALTLFLQLVGELDDEDPVLRDQPDQGHQANLGVDVQRRRPAVREEVQVRVRHLQESHQERPEHGQRDGSRQDHERVPEAVELGRQHQEDEDDGEQERGKELVALGAKLP